MFDKYICRIIKKPEPTLDDVVEYYSTKILDVLFNIILRVAVCIMVLSPCYFFIYILRYGFLAPSTESTQTLLAFTFTITIVDILSVIAIVVCHIGDLMYSKIKDKKVAKCPAKK
jgi:hypothetical protein